MAGKFHSEIYDTLTRHTRLALKRQKWRWGKPYVFRPRAHLLTRLSNQFGISRDEAFNRLMELRRFLIDNPQYFR